MSSPHKQWTVLPHGPLEEIDDGILTVTGEIGMPLGKLERRMTVVRLNGRRLVIYSAIALDPAGMARLESFGQPAFLIVPSDLHRLDARIYKDRYPAMKVVAPEGARTKVEEVVPVDTVNPDFADATVRFVTVPGVAGHEAALVVHRAGGTTLVLNDLVGNIHNASGPGGLILKAAGFAGDQPQIPRVVNLKIIEDKLPLRRQLEAWADIATLTRIIVSHGDPIVSQPQETLRRLAQSLD